jgi:hypothetical protein
VPACTVDTDCPTGKICSSDHTCADQDGSSTGSSSGGALGASPSASTLSASPLVLAADGVSAVAVTVTLLDASLAALPAKTVSLSSTRGAIDTIVAASPVSNASGQASFNVTSQTPGPATLSATDVTDAVNLQATVDITFTAPAALQFTVGSASPTPANPALFGASDDNLSETFTLANGGDNPTSQIALSFVGATGPGAAPDALWSIHAGSDNCSGTTLATSASCTVTIDFLASTNGAVAGDYATTLQAIATTGGVAQNAMSGTAAYTASGAPCTPRGATIPPICTSSFFYSNGSCTANAAPCSGPGYSCPLMDFDYSGCDCTGSVTSTESNTVCDGSDASGSSGCVNYTSGGGTCG